jgi:hypothetical protein
VRERPSALLRAGSAHAGVTEPCGRFPFWEWRYGIYAFVLDWRLVI